MRATSSLAWSRRAALVCFTIGLGFAAAAGCSSGTNGAGDDAGASTTTDGAAAGEDGAAAAPTPQPPCTKATDCPSGVCDVAKQRCAPATCTDGAKNAAETDLDCGGATCPKCSADKACATGGDCESGVCVDEGQGKKCQAPTCEDAVANALETDVDCGGTTCGKCVDGKKCKVRDDCASDVCVNGTCQIARCDDGAKNGTDTDVDCGGPACPRCADTLACLGADDCLSSVCADTGNGLRCQPPSPTDGVKNGGETDVDCGGPNAPACAVGKACAAGTDCTTGGCNDLKRCAAGRSCTRQYGGRTCGLGGEGGVGAAQWEDCCATAPVTVGGATVQLDKYQVTAGRMRAFLEDVGYDVRGFVQGARAGGRVPQIPGDASGRTVLESAWDLYLPTSFDGNQGQGELGGCAQQDCTPVGNRTCTCAPNTNLPGIYTAVARHLGGYIFNANAQSSTGCFVGAPGSHAFRFPAGKQDGLEPDYDETVYDTKSMNCVDYLVAQAFCVWDGGRLETLAEWQAAYGANTLPWGAAPAPTRGVNRSETYWGCRFPWVTDATYPPECVTAQNPATGTIDYADYRYSYEYPKLRYGAGTTDGADFIVFASAPGRTLGRGPAGHADVVGTHFELTSNVTVTASYAASGQSPFQADVRWSGNGSWEVHDYSKSGWGPYPVLLNKYGKLGLRCAHP